MYPDNDDENKNELVGRTGAPLQPVGRGNSASQGQRDAAANITRDQISRIYNRDSPYKQFDRTDANPYERTHAGVPSEQAAASTTEHFQKYHTAWQDYYQKYYESYYTQAVRQTQEQLRLKAQMEGASEKKPVFGAPQQSPGQGQPTDQSGAVRQLQADLRHRISAHAGKVRGSRHFWPLITAASVAVVFLFLQYNRNIFANVAAYTSPGSVDPQNIIVDPSTDTKVGPDPKIVIPKINVDAPVIYTVPTMDNDTIEANLKNGTVHYPIAGANAFPGQKGNNVIGGHSSNDVFDDGKYKFVFVQLEKLAVGDTIYLNYESTRYTYHIVKTQTIEPNQISELTAYTDKPYLSLVTCTPVGTALHRFIVVAEQVSPDPSGAAAQTSGGSAADTSIPGNSPTLLERLFR